MGGAERQLIELSAALAAAGAEVHVATVFPGACDARLASTGATTHRLRALGRYDLTLVPRIAALIRRLEPDVVITWLIQMDIVAGLAALVTRVPWILCERSAAGSYPRALLPAVRAHLGGYANAVVANSEGGREYWKSRIDEERIRVIPNIVPFDEIARAGPLPDDVPADEDVILYVGRFSAEKNIERLVEALARVLPGRKAKAVFCGDGVLRPAIETKVSALGIAGRALFLGNVSNVFAWMKRAAVVVGVSVFEGHPNTILEAMACGAPVVVSDIAPYRAVIGGDAAALVDPLSVDSIARGLAAVLDDRVAARACAERARAVVAGVSAAAIAARYVDVVQDVIVKKR